MCLSTVDGNGERVVKLWKNPTLGLKGDEMNRLRSIDWKELPIVSILLVAVNVIVFLISSRDGGRLVRLGRLDVQDVLVKGEYARFIWYMFLHSGIEHIFNNMVMLFFLGSMIEKQIGHIPYAVIYFLSGIGGGMISLYVRLRLQDPVGSVGASAAIFGLDGLLLAMVLFFGSTIPTVTPKRILLMIALSVYSGFTSENIDNAGHLGGLLTGLLVGAIYCMVRKAVLKARMR